MRSKSAPLGAASVQPPTLSSLKMLITVSATCYNVPGPTKHIFSQGVANTGGSCLCPTPSSHHNLLPVINFSTCHTPASGAFSLSAPTPSIMNPSSKPRRGSDKSMAAYRQSLPSLSELRLGVQLPDNPTPAQGQPSTHSLTSDASSSRNRDSERQSRQRLDYVLNPDEQDAIPVSKDSPSGLPGGLPISVGGYLHHRPPPHHPYKQGQVLTEPTQLPGYPVSAFEQNQIHSDPVHRPPQSADCVPYGIAPNRYLDAPGHHQKKLVISRSLHLCPR